MAGKITTWIKEHISSNKIDYMSLNRLRQNITATGTIPTRLAYTKKTRMAENLLSSYIHDISIKFENMAVLVDPFRLSPLTALIIFHTDMPCRLRYEVTSPLSKHPFVREFENYTTTHAVPIFGLCPDCENTVTVEIKDENNTVVNSCSLPIQTEKLPSDSDTINYPKWVDCDGVIRYFLSVPSFCEDIIAVGNDQFLFVDGSIRTYTGSEPLPTHLYEMDLLGRVYRTYYVGSGICHVYGELPEGNILISALDPTNDNTEAFFEIDRGTGALIRTEETSIAASDIVEKRNISLGEDILKSYTMVAFHDMKELDFDTMGWLKSPALHKVASVGTTSATTLEHMAKNYQMNFSICGDTLLIDTMGDQIQEIVFSKIDRIYQLDLTFPLMEEEEYKKYRYTLAVPFTEMYSGTYSIVIRFRDGSQEVLADALSLSRARS